MPFTDWKPLPTTDACRDPEHNPPSHIVLPDGVHTYRCPSCGREVTIRVQRPTL